MTTPSVKNKSQHGSDGREETRMEKIEIVDSPEYQESTSGDYKKATRSEYERPDVELAVELTGSDKKLAIKMTKSISDYLGLSGKSRSVRV